MRILNNGNVGIRTTEPGAKLEVASPSSCIAMKVGRASGQPSIKGLGGWLILDAPTNGKLGLNYWESGNVIIANGGGKVGIGVPGPVISGTGKLHMAANTFRLDTARTPASAAAAGNAGEFCWDASYLYVCIAAATWRRLAHNTW